MERSWTKFCDKYEEKVKASEIIQNDIKKIYDLKEFSEIKNIKNFELGFA